MLRACEASIDIANHIVNEKRLGLPKSARKALNCSARTD
ncbi:hypothetical protein OAC75_05900 [Pseudomonadales bacterium]|nr:hypothetical protein [Pseudomonadales bacterium]